MNFYFLRFLKAPGFTISSKSIGTVHLSRQFSIKLLIKEGNLSIVHPASWDSRSPALLTLSFLPPGTVPLGHPAVSSLLSSGGCCMSRTAQRKAELPPGGLGAAHCVWGGSEWHLNTAISMGTLGLNQVFTQCCPCPWAPPGVGHPQLWTVLPRPHCLWVKIPSLPLT